MYKAFARAKEAAYRQLYDSNALSVGLPWLIAEVEESHRVRGNEIWDYSLEGSRTTLEAPMQYLHEQGLTRRRMPLEELFVPNIRKELHEYLRATGEG